MIVSFYSFKGGVGRSLASAFVAAAMARRGLRILVVDLDLEAPGLERFLLESRDALAWEGMCDLIASYERAITNPVAHDQAEFMQLERFIAPVLQTGNGGRLDLMPAGRRAGTAGLRDYAEFVRRLDVKRFMEALDGRNFFAWLRAHWLKAYDVVVMDNRAGITELGGVAIGGLSDVVVCLVAPNLQSLDGMAHVVRDFTSDPSGQGLCGGTATPLAIPAHLQMLGPLVSEFLAYFERIFGGVGLPRPIADAGHDFSTLAIPYEPSLVGFPQLVDAPVEGGRSFERLADAILLLRHKVERPAVPPDPAFPRLLREQVTAFLCHSKDDKPAVRALHAQLRANGISPWLDEIDLVPGQDWRTVISDAVRSSEVVLVCLSRHSVAKDGFVQREISYALDRAEDKPEGRLYIVPVRLEDCEVPNRLSRWQWVDLYASDGYEKLKLPRFRGHFFTREGVRDANPQAAVSSGVSSTDGRVGTRRPRHQRAGPRVRLQRQQHSRMGQGRWRP